MKQKIVAVANGFKKFAEVLKEAFKKPAKEIVYDPEVLEEVRKQPMIFDPGEINLLKDNQHLVYKQCSKPPEIPAVDWNDEELQFLKCMQSKRTPVEEAMKWMIIPEEIKVNRKLQHRKNKSQRSNWRKWKVRK